MHTFIKDILTSNYGSESDLIFNNNHLIQYIDSKVGAISGDSKKRRSFANLYAIYSITHFYAEEFYEKPELYKQFEGYEYTKLFVFYRSLYGGEKLQNHALNSRVNGEFLNKFPDGPAPIVINNGKYALHINYLYTNNKDVSKTINQIIEKYAALLEEKDHSLIADIKELQSMNDVSAKKKKIESMLSDDTEARIFEIVSYAVLKNHYKNQHIFIGYTMDSIKIEQLSLYKTGRTNANDGGIDFVMRPVGRFFQVTETNNYDKYTLDMDKVLHFPITFVIKTHSTIEEVRSELDEYIEKKSGGMVIIKERYEKAIEEIITINELKKWLNDLDEESVNSLLRDIDIYYRLELNIE